MTADGGAVPGPPEGDGTVTLDADRITTTTRDPAETATRLQAWLGRTFGPQAHPAVTGLSTPASNGMSSETVLFTAAWDDGGTRTEQPMVARIEPPATDCPVFPTYDLGMQFRVMRLVGEHTSVPVPRTLWYEPDPTVLGGAFFVMDRVDGLVPPDVLPYTFGDNWVFDADPADRRRLQQSAIEAMAGIHSVTPDRFDLGFLRKVVVGPAEHTGPGGTSLERLVQRWKQYAAWVVQDSPSPLLTECFDWLEQHRPTEVGGDALSWGDGRIGNMMFRDFEVVAVLDWEMASVAPPEVDLGGSATSTCSSTIWPPTSGHPACPTCSVRSMWLPPTPRSPATPPSTSPGSSPLPPSGTAPSCAGSPSGPSSSARRPCPTTSTT